MSNDNMDSEPSFKSMMKSVRTDGTGIPNEAFRKGYGLKEQGQYQADLYAPPGQAGPRVGEPIYQSRPNKNQVGIYTPEDVTPEAAVPQAGGSPLTPPITPPSNTQNVPNIQRYEIPDKDALLAFFAQNNPTKLEDIGASADTGVKDSPAKPKSEEGSQNAPGKEKKTTPENTGVTNSPAKPKSKDGSQNASDAEKKQSKPRSKKEKTDQSKARDPGEFNNGADDSNGEDDVPVTKSDPILDAISMMRYGHAFQKADVDELTPMTDKDKVEDEQNPDAKSTSDEITGVSGGIEPVNPNPIHSD